MGQLSWIHWIVVLLVSVAPIVAIALVKPAARTARQAFIKLTVIDVAILAVGIAVFSASWNLTTALAGIALLFVYACYRIYFLAKAATRLATLGWSKWWALFGVPMTGLEIVLGLMLCIPRSAEEPA